MVGYKLKIDKSDIERLLHGHNAMEGVRYIDVSYYSNKANVFIRKHGEENVTMLVESFQPFLYFKGFNFEEDFQWEYKSYPISKYDENINGILIGENIKYLNDTDFVLHGFTPQGNEIIIKSFLPNIQDRKKLCYAKIKEYNIKMKELITTFDEKQKISRLEEGFKYLIHIEESEPKYYTNAAIAYTKKGGLKKISGSYSNLLDFFREGGIDVSKKSGIFLNKLDFENFWYNATNFQKALFFISLPNPEVLFTISSSTDKNIDFDDDSENQTETSVLDFEILRNFFAVHYTLNVKNKDIVHGLHTQLIHDPNFKNLLNDQQILSAFDLKIDNTKLNDLLENDYSFETKKTFKQALKILISENINVFQGEDRMFYTLPPLEQFMIQKGIRLYKGFEDYADMHIMTVDIETKALDYYINDNRAALSPFKGRIFKIGIKTNYGCDVILDANNDKQEIVAIEKLLTIIKNEKPDLLITYNGESFDYPFIFKRYELLKRFENEDKCFDYIREHFFSNMYDFGENYIYQKSLFGRRNGTLKIGGSSEQYLQTNILGVNLCDTMFAVKRAMAINKSIPNAKLKDNIKYAKLNEPNRVYIKGDDIGKVENSTAKFYLNPNTGHWIEFNKNIKFVQNYQQSLIKKKSQTYSIYENENTLYVWDNQIDGEWLKDCGNTLMFDSYAKHDQKSIDDFFLLLNEKIISYETICFRLQHIGFQLKDNTEVFNYLKSKLKTIRENISKKEFFYPNINFSEYVETTGVEIVRLYLLGDLKETIKLDEYYSQATFLISKWLPTSYQRAATMGGASVWKLLLTSAYYQYNIAIPDFDEGRDFSGGLVAMYSAGWHGKSVKFDFASLYPAVFFEHIKTPDIDILGVFKQFVYYGWSERIKFKTLMNESKSIGDLSASKKFEAKQLPIKILINSFYGMLGAFAVTPFAHILSAQGITANGRQQLRFLIKKFMDDLFYPTIAHTDGVFFSYTDVDLNFEYIGRGDNWLVKKDKVYNGLEAYVARYNDTYMKGIMGLDIDEVVESVINFAKGNYIYYKKVKDKNSDNLIDKIEIVGGSVVKKNQSQYIIDFVEDNIIHMMQNNPVLFLDNYWEYIKKIENFEIPTIKIASKAKIKKSKNEYVEHLKGKNKNGQPLNEQVHMRLLIDNNIDFEVGDYAYYINTGKLLKDKDSQTINEKFATISTENIEDLHNFYNIFKNDNRVKIKEYLISLYESAKLKINNCVESGDIYSYLDNIEKWKGIKVQNKVLKSGTYIDIIKREYIVKSQLIDINGDNNIKYNSELYIHKFNSAIHPLFICFNENIRDKIIINSSKDRPFLLSDDLKLINGQPIAENSQIDIESSMQLSVEELDYWETINYDSNLFLDKQE